MVFNFTPGVQNYVGSRSMTFRYWLRTCTLCISCVWFSCCYLLISMVQEKD